MNISEILKAPFFKGLTEEMVLPFLLSDRNVVKRYKKGEFIARQGDVCRSLYLLCSGQVLAQMVNDEGKQLTIEKLSGPLLLAPAFTFCTANRFPVNIEPENECEVVVINKVYFLEFIHHYPLAMENFIGLLSNRVLFLSSQLNAFALQSLKERLINYIRLHGSISSQQEVAQRLGVARPSLTRTLSELTAEGCIVNSGKEFSIDEEKAKKYF